MSSLTLDTTFVTFALTGGTVMLEVGAAVGIF